MSRLRLSLWAILRIPVAVALLSGFGLVAALLGDGHWDHVGAVALASTVAVTLWALVRRRR